MTPLRRTKIVATIGPATETPECLDTLLNSGVDVVRLNFSHGGVESHRRRAQMVRESAQRLKRTVAILVDLQGPKIRIDRFIEGKVVLQEDANFTLDADMDPNAGTVERVGITYKTLPQEVRPGDTLVLSDGAIVLTVKAVHLTAIECVVRIGGELSNNKGINRQGGGLSAPALTDKDRADIVVAAALEADYLAVSFPKTAADIYEARALFHAAGGHGAIVAKIERAEALENLDEIIEATDAVMIARGDLGVEVGDAAVPALQKTIIRQARIKNKVAITATQMLQSMIASPTPTRAEVSDIANAVLDGTDAVMLSEETAIGKHPAKAVAAMSRICSEAEKHPLARTSDHRLDSYFRRVDEAIAMATMYTANHLDVKAIAALTESGSSVLWMSRISSCIPVYALTRHDATRRRVTLYRGVYPLNFGFEGTDTVEANREIIDSLVRQGVVATGDLVVITKGDMSGVAGGTNTMKIARVGQAF